jgi:hypothetical protein
MSGLRKITKNSDLSKIKMIVRACWVEVVIPDELIMPAKRLHRIKESRLGGTGFGATPEA